MLRKVLVARLSPLALVFFLTLGQVPVLGAWAATQGLPTITFVYATVVVGSVVLNIMANVAFMEAVRTSPLSVTVPLLSLTPAFAAAFAVPLVGEVPSGNQMAGIGLVVAGALSLGIGGGVRTTGSWLKKLARQKGSLLMVLVAVCWSLTMPLDKIGVVQVGPAWHAFVLSAGVAGGTLALLLWMGWRRDLAALTPDVLPRLGLAVLVSSLALALQLAAIHFVFVGLVEAVKRAVGNLAALLFGWWLFQEPITLRKVMALAVMAVGVALVVQ